MSRSIDLIEVFMKFPDELEFFWGDNKNYKLFIEPTTSESVRYPKYKMTIRKLIRSARGDFRIDDLNKETVLWMVDLFDLSYRDSLIREIYHLHDLSPNEVEYYLKKAKIWRPK